jgi:hypothetical protein
MAISMLVTLLGRHDVVAATKRLRIEPDLCVSEGQNGQ